MEEGLKTNFPTWTIRIVPPVAELPLIAFDNGENVISPAGESVLGDSIWALEHWSTKTVEVVGYASTSGALQRFDNRTLAYQRAVTVADRLTQAGFTSFVRDHKAAGRLNPPAPSSRTIALTSSSQSRRACNMARAPL